MYIRDETSIWHDGFGWGIGLSGGNFAAKLTNYGIQGGCLPKISHQKWELAENTGGTKRRS